MSTLPPQTQSWLRSALAPGTNVLAVELLPPASHANHRVRVETPGGKQVDLLLRRFTDRERLGSDPWYDPAAEVEALRALEPLDLPVPQLLAEDAGATTCEVPTLLLTWLPGGAPAAPSDTTALVRGLAEPLPKLHAAAALPSMRRYEPYFASDGTRVEDLRPPEWAFDPSTWERAFEAVAAGAPETPNRFIHRDYYHGNTLWKGNHLTGIVDWTTGSSGPAGIDVAQARINLAWDFDLQTADAFLEAWRALGGEPDPYHPYWDLLDAVDWLGDGSADPDDDVDALRRYETFVAQALAELG
jgi:aminoglycoside phosphotransferase (APT) family kinase protein